MVAYMRQVTMVHLIPGEIEFDSLDDVFGSMGAAGARVSAIEASEGAAGNISVLYSWTIWKFHGMRFIM